MYNTIQEMAALAEKNASALWEVVLENECEVSGMPPESIFAQLNDRYEVMLHSAELALEHPLKTAGGLIEGVASVQYRHAADESSVSGGFLNLVMARALSSSEANAAMGKICAAPTAGACGILPAVLISVGERYQLGRDEILRGLLTASGIGAVITHNATVSGAEGGCQAECGVAAAMAAAAAVQMAGGSNDAAINAVCFALMNCMGLVCDPVAGLVQVPCAQRNASQAVNAILSADLALGGMQSVIPADEVIDAMYRVGKMLPMQLRETALGGIASTPTGKQIFRRIFN